MKNEEVRLKVDELISALTNYKTYVEQLNECAFSDRILERALKVSGELESLYWGQFEDIKGYNNLKNKVVEVEDYHGNTIMAFDISSNGSIEQYSNCEIADIDSDYIFNTDKDLVRIQCTKDTNRPKDTMKCPMCEEEHFYCQEHNGTYIYVCEDCPFVGFELVERKDEENMIKWLEEKNNGNK